MNISSQFIKRPVMTCLVMAAIALFGLYGYAVLPVSELPNVDFPTITVQANLPGADPETMASAVATPLENVFASVPGLDTMTSSSQLGSTNIVLQFRLSRNIDSAAEDVQAAISGVLRRLPHNMPYPPTLRKVDPSSQPIFYVSLYSDTVSSSKVDQYARSILATQLSTVDGVAQVNIFGQARYAVRIQADPAQLAARHLTLLDLSTAANSINTNQASGALNGPTKTQIIRAEGQLENAEAFRNQVIAYQNGAPVRLGDVAHVADSFEDVRSIDWLNNKRAVTLTVQRQPDSNTMAIVDNIKKILPRFAAQLPAGIAMKVFYDRSQTIRAAVDDVQITLLIAAALVVAVIFVFLRKVSATIIPSLALPITISGHLRRNSRDGLQSRQSFADGAHPFGRLRRRRRHRHAGKHRPPCRSGRAARHGGASRVARDRLHDSFHDHIACRGFHSHSFHGRRHRAAAARIRGHHHDRHHDFRDRFGHAYADAGRPRAQGRTARTPWPLYRWSEPLFDRMRDAYDRSLRWALRHRPLILGLFVASVLASYGLFSVDAAGFPAQRRYRTDHGKHPDDHRNLLRPDGFLYQPDHGSGGTRPQHRLRPFRREAAIS